MHTKVFSEEGQKVHQTEISPPTPSICELGSRLESHRQGEALKANV